MLTQKCTSAKLKSQTIIAVGLLLSAAFLSVCTLLAQQHQLKFDRLSTHHGLSQVSVYSIVQDGQGFIWFGTEDGLNRFDGYAFRIYRHDPLDSTSLSNSWIECLLIDSKGTLWVGTYGGGLNRYNHRTETFQRFKYDPNNPQTPTNDFVYAIAEDQQGLIWFATEKGLSRLDPTTGAVTRFLHDSTNINSLINDAARTLHVDRKGNLWVGTIGGLCRYDPQENRFVRYAHNPSNTRSISHDRVRCVYQDRKGRIWVGTRAGLDLYDETRDSFDRMPLLVSDQSRRTVPNVFRILEDRNGIFWIGTNDAGMFRYDERSGELTPLPHHPLDLTSLSSNAVRSVFQDRSGVLWIGTLGGGVNRLRENAFVHIRHEPWNQNSLSGSIVFSILEDRSGVVWIGTDQNGLNAYDTKHGRFIHFTHSPSDPYSLSANTVRAIVEDRNGVLWLGTFNGGLNRYDAKTRRFIRYLNDPSDPSSISHNGVRTIHEDSRGLLWIGTNGGGLNRFDPKTQRFTRFHHRVGDPTSLSSDVVSAILEDRSGVLWMGTRAGLNRFDRQRMSFHRYTSTPADSTTLSSDYVVSICEDRNGDLWIGTMMGLNRFDKAANRFERFFEKDGLPNNTVYGILEDDEGFLWLSTNRGLSRFDPTTRRFRNFDRRDGLQDDEFNTGAFHRGRSGRFYFGGVNGVSAFLPERLQDNPHAPPVVLTSFKVFGEPVQLPAPIWRVEELQLSYEQNFFSLEFAALDFTMPEKNQYAYRLEGFDADWNFSGTRRYASYTNVGPGSYLFRVKASNNDGVWNEEGVAVRITIVPPFWQTGWFRIAATAGLLLMIYGLYRHRVNRLLEVERMRTRIATDLHDDIGTSLSSIAISSDVARQTIEQNPAEARVLLEAVSGTARTLVDAMNDIVWAIKPENDLLDNLVLRMQEFAIRLLESRGIDVRFQKPPEVDVGRLQLPLDVRRNIYLIFKEMVNNVAKHACCTGTDIRIELHRHSEHRRGQVLLIEVKDNGEGFDLRAPTRGNGLQNMQRRAAAINASLTVVSQPGNGTSAQLRVPVKIP